MLEKLWKFEKNAEKNLRESLELAKNTKKNSGAKKKFLKKSEKFCNLKKNVEKILKL